MTSMELRQALAGLLTLSMFIMLGNMVKKDHFDPYFSVDVEATPSTSGTVTVTGQSLATVSHLSKETSKQTADSLKPCWNPPMLKSEQSKGFITFSLTNGPEYHLSQIADAVVVARYVGATLVLPDIRSSKQGYRMNFGDIYDVQKFLDSLNGIVKVTRTQPPQASSNGNLPTVKVPNRVTEDYIERIVKPIYQAKGTLRIESNFPSSLIINSTMAPSDQKKKKNLMNPAACKAMFGSLQLQQEVQEVVGSMVHKLRTWSQNLNGKFIAVDFKSEMCDAQRGRNSCYKADEIGVFLKKLGFGQETVVYVTQLRWHSDLDALKNIFPKTYTKESIIPEEKRGKFLNSEISEYEKVIDFNLCSESDVFVPSLPDLFYTNVVAVRIASGKNQILVPSDEIASNNAASASDFISPYVSQKTHFAYSCFC
ncbi:protein MANNAN SYNTHESIS-RELATED-like isoform X2 [Prosopis cineraria]|uniref:protein MANNAN SYNTHESIS-RELATED-like isoform X2 n=1 Tax=Prosopis cineraria TaxID=364024 RepID=UPI0024108024|nr:protein MANNAN SYNTHESIS-RELATED-like isoform X2 [Prosopis cineraria]